MKYVGWAILMLAAIIVVGIVSHATALAFGVCIGVWAIGGWVEIAQIKGGGKNDTTMLPYAIQTIGAVIMFIWR